MSSGPPRGKPGPLSPVPLICLHGPREHACVHVCDHTDQSPDSSRWSLRSLCGHTVILGCLVPSARRKSHPQPATLLTLSGDCHAPPSGSLSPPPLPAAPPLLPSQPALARKRSTALLKATACPAPRHLPREPPRCPTHSFLVSTCLPPLLSPCLSCWGVSVVRFGGTNHVGEL